MTFDGAAKLISLSSSTLGLQELWSAWKDWLLAGNAGYALAMNTVGGEPINEAEGTLVPLFLFMLNGWKIKPMEADHTLYVTGGTLVGPDGGDPFVDTNGEYTVRVVYQQPVQAIGYSTSGASGPTADAIAAAILAAAQITPIHSDVQRVRSQNLVGSGVELDPWGPA